MLSILGWVCGVSWSQYIVYSYITVALTWFIFILLNQLRSFLKKCQEILLNFAVCRENRSNTRSQRQSWLWGCCHCLQTVICRFPLSPQSGLVICGTSEDNLFSSLSWSSDWEQAGNSLVLTGNGSPSEVEESHFVMSFLPQIGSGGRGRRGSSTGADTGVWWELKYPVYETNITSTMMLLCFNVVQRLSPVQTFKFTFRS